MSEATESEPAFDARAAAAEADRIIAEADAAEAKAKADLEQPASSAPAKAEELPFYAVAQGKHITTRRGQIGPGEEVREHDLSGRTVPERLRTLADLVRGGAVVINPKP